MKHLYLAILLSAIVIPGAGTTKTTTCSETVDNEAMVGHSNSLSVTLLREKKDKRCLFSVGGISPNLVAEAVRNEDAQSLIEILMQDIMNIVDDVATISSNFEGSEERTLACAKEATDRTFAGGGLAFYIPEFEGDSPQVIDIEKVIELVGGSGNLNCFLVQPGSYEDLGAYDERLLGVGILGVTTPSLLYYSSNGGANADYFNFLPFGVTGAQ